LEELYNGMQLTGKNNHLTLSWADDKLFAFMLYCQYSSHHQVSSVKTLGWNRRTKAWLKKQLNFIYHLLIHYVCSFNKLRSVLRPGTHIPPWYDSSPMVEKYITLRYN